MQLPEDKLDHATRANLRAVSYEGTGGIEKEDYYKVSLSYLRLSSLLMHVATVDRCFFCLV